MSFSLHYMSSSVMIRFLLYPLRIKIADTALTVNVEEPDVLDDVLWEAVIHGSADEPTPVVLRSRCPAKQARRAVRSSGQHLSVSERHVL